MSIVLENKHILKLAKDYGISVKTVQSKLDEYQIQIPQVKAQEVILLIDTTYFGELGVMIFKDAKRNKNLHIKIVDNENNNDYKNGVKELEKDGWIIKAIVCDGRRGLIAGFDNIPT